MNNQVKTHSVRAAGLLEGAVIDTHVIVSGITEMAQQVKHGYYHALKISHERIKNVEETLWPEYYYGRTTN